MSLPPDTVSFLNIIICYQNWLQKVMLLVSSISAHEADEIRVLQDLCEDCKTTCGETRQAINNSMNVAQNLSQCDDETVHFLQKNYSKIMEVLGCIIRIFPNTFSTIDNVLPISREIWVMQKSDDWWQSNVCDSWNEIQWFQNFRMTKDVFTKLVETLTPHLKRKDTCMRKAISVEKRLAITLLKLATTDGYRSVAARFGVGVSTVCNIVIEVCKTINDILLPKVIQFHDLSEIVNGFQMLGFPQCMGAINGSHIRIIAPAVNKESYVCRKGYHSIVLQAIVDANGLFTDVFAGFHGGAHNSAVMHASPFFKKKNSGNFFSNPILEINGMNVSPVIIADPAYTCLPWLMKPYPRNQLNADTERFNNILTRARQVVERSFGRLKSRWRSLGGIIEMQPERVAELAVTACVLHNVCETGGDALSWPAQICNDQELADVVVPGAGQIPTAVKNRGNAVRTAYCNFFKELHTEPCA
uniref:DDE Tnp4 domain-containing protein n=1 Tax=Sphenodon punctatus TaxID=8508 RepID=A0A8D0GQE7_SPHPU